MSADIGLGVPFNIASYALLTEIFAKLCGLKAGHFVHTLGDAHIYSNHKQHLIHQILYREPRQLPKLILPDTIKEGMDIDEMLSVVSVDDFKIVDYNPYPAIKMEMAI